MKIALDAKRALNNYTGLGNHARILINALTRLYPQNEYLLFSPRVKEDLLNQLQGSFGIFLPGQQPGGTMAANTGIFSAWGLIRRTALWRSWGIKRDLQWHRPQLYHGLSNEIPFGLPKNIAAVATIHDVIFLKHTAQYPWVDRQFYKLKTKYAVEHANKVIAVSNETKQDLLDIYKVPERRVEVIYPSIDPVFYHSHQSSFAEIKARYGLPPSFILQVGSFFPRKNHLTTIKAFAAIANKIPHSLVFAGSGGTVEKQVKQAAAAQSYAARIHFINNIPSAHLPALYQLADAFVFPSLFEGFGAPVLEALFSGTPVIATKGGAIEEAAGKQSLLVSPLDAEDIADKLLKVLGDSLLRRSMIDAGLQHARGMTDTVFAEKTMQVYQSLS